MEIKSLIYSSFKIFLCGNGIGRREKEEAWPKYREWCSDHSLCGIIKSLIIKQIIKENQATM